MASFTHSIRLLHCLFVAFILAAPLSTPAKADCEQLFVGGRPPALLNPKMEARTTSLCNTAYATLQSGVTRGPLWSAEHLTDEALTQARATPREGRFFEDDRVPAEDRASLADYARSGYDRGHMTPSGDMPDTTAQQESFALSNIVPQAPKLNRGTWEGIESAVRHLAEQRGDMYVVTGPAYQGRQLKSLQGRVLVPSATWKAVYVPSDGAGAYICTNVNRPRCETISIAALIRMTSIDPFPALPDRVKESGIQLPPPEPSHYASRRNGHQRHKHHSLLDWLR